jgi:hypothetical protein
MEQVFNPVWAVRDARNPALTFSHKAVLYALASRLRSSTDKAFPSVVTLADDAGGCQSQTKVLLSELVAWQVLSKEVELDGRGRHNVYSINFEELARTEPYDAPARRPRPWGSKRVASAAPPAPGSVAPPAEGSASAPADISEGSAAPPAPGSVAPPAEGWAGAPARKIQEEDTNGSYQLQDPAESVVVRSAVAPASITAGPLPTVASGQLTLIPGVAPDAAGKRRNAAKHAVMDLDPATLTAQEHAALDAIAADPSLARITTAPAQLARDLVKAGPGLDVAYQIARAGAWLRANPREAKKNGNRFLNTWVARAQERLPIRAESGGSPASAGGELCADERARAVALANAIGRSMNIACSVLDGAPITARMLVALESAHRESATRRGPAPASHIFQDAEGAPDDVPRRVIPGAKPPPPIWVTGANTGGRS